MSDTPETDAQLTTFTSISKLKKHFVNRRGTVSAEFARGLERERNSLQDQRDFCMGEIERLRKERDEARKAPRHDPQWHPLTESKTQFICQRDGMTVSGFVVTSPATGECAIIDKSAVRWLSKDELWWLMHESDSPLNA